jgi:adenosyl cobinamide kinase/adenosyl cobinamide phosphate guanylyltransferase
LTQLTTKWKDLPTPKPTFFLVSAEVGASPPPYQDHERFFRQSVGIANQFLAAWAQTVITVQAGLVSVLKAPLS